jgi:phage baseplate assembly protein V
MKLIRTLLTNAAEGVIKRFSATGRANETITDREIFQHYGFTSIPQPGAEGIAVNEGGHIVLIATDDRRYRLAVAQGAVALYTDEGDYILLGRDRNITVVGGTSVKVQTPKLEITGMNGGTTEVSINGDVAVTGNQSVTGNVTAGGEVTGNPVVSG